MAKTVSRKRIIGNPGAKRSGRSNPGDIIGFSLLGAGNPGRKAGTGMATKKKAKKKASGRGSYTKSRYKKHNPGRSKSGGHSHSTKRRYKRHNTGGAMSSLGPMVTNAVFVIVGALGSKLGAQAVLGTNNVGLVGYAGNAAAGGILWFLTEKVMRNRAAAAGVIAGTIVQIVLRIINDYTPFGQYVAQLGMGDYQMQSFVTPQVLVDPWRNAEIAIPSGWGARGPAALPPAGGGNGAPSIAAQMTAAAGGNGGGAGLSGGGNLYGNSSLY